MGEAIKRTLITACSIALVAFIVWGFVRMWKLDAEEGRRWELFKAEHHCVAVDHRTTYSGGYPGTQRSETKTLWKCDNGEHWR